MALTFAQLQTQLRAMSGLGSSSQDTTLLKQYLNMAARDVWMAWEWPERIKEAFVSTVIPYTTGTATVTNGDATVEFAGGAVLPSSPALTAARRFALAYGEPSYLIATRTDDDTLELARNYVGDTASGQAYAIYADLYDLASDVDTILSVRLHHERPNGNLVYLARSTLDGLDYLPTMTGRPVYWALLPDQTAGTRRIQVYPIPDAVYSLSYLYLKSYTDMSGDSDACDVAESRRDLVVWHALEWAYALAEKDEKAAFAKVQYESGLARAIHAEASVRPVPRRMGRFDRYSHGDLRGLWYPFYRT